jgi:hypothetical protein
VKVKVKPWRGAPKTVAEPGIGEAWTHTFMSDGQYKAFIRVQDGTRFSPGHKDGVFYSVRLRDGLIMQTYAGRGDIVPLRLEKVLKDGTAVFAAAGKTGKGKGK